MFSYNKSGMLYLLLHCGPFGNIGICLNLFEAVFVLLSPLCAAAEVLYVFFPLLFGDAAESV